jgi:hypothetical protein
MVISLSKALRCMTIERNNQDIVIRLDAALFDIGDVQKLINHFRFVESNARNNGTEEQATALAREVETSWWAENRQKFLP